MNSKMMRKLGIKEEEKEMVFKTTTEIVPVTLTNPLNNKKEIFKDVEHLHHFLSMQNPMCLSKLKNELSNKWVLENLGSGLIIKPIGRQILHPNGI